ncbi:lactadherin-like [Oculina patagonica]
MGKFQACLRKAIIPLFVTAGFVIVVTTGACSDGKCSASSRFVIGENMADGYALIGYVFANVSVAGALNCYQICQPNCRCISFNFLTNVKQDNCQLNEENRHLKPSALVPMKGSQYYEVVITYGTSWSPCSQCINRCCSDQPCFNGGTCREKCEAAGKRFVCACPAGFVGQLCEKDCKKALGMESRAISDEQISASSEIDSIHAAIQGRLHFQETMPYKAGGWAAARADNNQWLQVDLGSLNMIVTGVATQGRNSQEYYQWVTKYKLQHSNDGANFEYYKEEGQNADKEFAGNTDSNTVVYHGLNPPIKARYIRFQPVAWNRHIMMRVELYGCQDCKKALGMESGAISDGQISASSEWNDFAAASNGRLHLQEKNRINAGGWVALTQDVNQWLQVDLGSLNTIVTGVATQGRPVLSRWVTKYKLQYSDDGVNFQYYKEQGQSTDKEFAGNTDRNTVVYHDLNPPITARYIRFRPVAWYYQINMRVELYGCQDI